MRKKPFSLELIICILFPDHTFDYTSNGYEVNRGKVAELNDLLFRHIAQHGELIDEVARKRSRPEILAQLPKLATLNFEDTRVGNFEKLRRKLGETVVLNRVMKNLPLDELQPKIRKKKEKRIKSRERRRLRLMGQPQFEVVSIESELKEATG